MGHRRRGLPVLDAPQVAQHLRDRTRVVHRPSPQAKLSIHHRRAIGIAATIPASQNLKRNLTSSIPVRSTFRNTNSTNGFPATCPPAWHRPVPAWTPVDPPERETVKISAQLLKIAGMVTSLMEGPVNRVCAW
jgi:hypothetical protein